MFRSVFFLLIFLTRERQAKVKCVQKSVGDDDDDDVMAKQAENSVKVIVVIIERVFPSI